MLVIEVPIQNPENERRLEQAKKDEQSLAQFGRHRHPLFDYAGFLGGSDIESRIVDKGNNQKQLEMTVGMKDFRPQEIKVSVKNNELIIQGEHVQKDNNRSGRSFFYRSAMLPPGTQIDQLQSYMDDNGQLKIEAPFVEHSESAQNQNEQIQQQSSQTLGTQNQSNIDTVDQNQSSTNTESQSQPSVTTEGQNQTSIDTESQRQSDVNAENPSQSSQNLQSENQSNLDSDSQNQSKVNAENQSQQS